MTNNLAALIAGVPRYSASALMMTLDGCKAQPAPEGPYVRHADVLAALEAATPPDLVEAGKVAEDCRAAVNGEGKRAYEWTDKPHRLVYDLYNTISALIALATTQAAQIAGLEAENHSINDSLSFQTNRAIADEQQVSVLRAKVAQLTKERDEWRDCAARNISKLGLALQNERDAKDSAEAKVAELEAQIAEARADYQRESDQHDETAAEAATLRDEVERLRGSLTVIDAMDPEGQINGFSESALRGTVLHMGAVARAALEGKT